MLIDWIATALPLAATEDLDVVTSLLSNILLWGRVALGIGLVIFVHELGHFAAAKTFGVKCEKFYVGFDVPLRIGPIKFPRTLGKFRYGETEYGIGIIPLGGYVKMLGQDDDPRKQEEEAKRIRVEQDTGEVGEAGPRLDPRSFPAKPVWQRMIIISAGVVMNVITGVLFAAMAFGFGVAYSPAIVGGVMPGGPSWQAGIQPGGKVVSVGSFSDPNMHFREMKLEILTEGLERPNDPIDVAIAYEDGVRHFKLRKQSRPDEKDARMIGLAIPNSTTLASDAPAYHGTIAAEVLTSDDAGATIIGFDGTAIQADAIVPGTPFFDHLYSHPDQPITLRLRRTDGSEHDVTLPPQRAKSIGIRFAIGPVVLLVDDGPAARAGLQVGDRIQRVGDDDSPDAYGLALALVAAGKQEKVRLTVLRGEADSVQSVEIEITPTMFPQTIPPTQSIAGEIAINCVGFAYQPLPTVAALVATDDRPTSSKPGEPTLQPGDRLQEIRLVLADSQRPEWLNQPGNEEVFERLHKGWEFTPETTLNTLCDAIQLLPEGTELKVLATRAPDNRVVESSVVVRQDDRVVYERGLALTARESIQRAGSLTEALVLGKREGVRRFNDVLRFLRMLPRGQVKLRHVGGPLEIVKIAKHEAEEGISRQLMFLTMLSMNLAILNFLPIPALDGGHMMFLLYEAVAGKRANEQLEFRLTVAGLLALLMLMVVVFANDILRHL
jgi:regulator of sigma E protease